MCKGWGKGGAFLSSDTNVLAVHPVDRGNTLKQMWCSWPRAH